MGLSSRHRWDARAVEFFRVMKLDGEAVAATYRDRFKCNEMEVAIQRLMQRVVKYNAENPLSTPKAAAIQPAIPGEVPNATPTGSTN